MVAHHPGRGLPRRHGLTPQIYAERRKLLDVAHRQLARGISANGRAPAQSLRGNIPLSPATPVQQRFQMFEPRLTTIKPRAQPSSIVDDFDKQVVHLRIERSRRLWDGASLGLGDAIAGSVGFIATQSFIGERA